MALTAAKNLPLALTGKPYSGSVTASGGTAPYVYSVSVGSLPTGLSLNTSTGAITGTVGANATTQNFTIHVHDSAGTPLTLDVATGINVVVSQDGNAGYNPDPINAKPNGGTRAGLRPDSPMATTNYSGTGAIGT